VNKLKDKFPNDENIQKFYSIENYFIESTNIINLEHIKSLYGNNYYYIKFFWYYF